ncbi:MAG: DUF1446 domain-containing protein [Acidobacteria bacterium]|nr:DUF1446 domain-containing protein [Acidobacteriota bacterium]
MKTVRIANGQGFWGDWLEAPVQLVERGPIDYLTLDYLAEITMSILQKQKSRDPNAGYARDFLYAVGRVLPKCLDQNIKIVANAGGVNPKACVAGLAEVVRKLGLSGKVKIGVVSGDDIMDRLDEFISRGIELKNMETGEELAKVRANVRSANVYFGAGAIADALDQGAQIVVTGRCTDTGLALGPMLHEFKWARDDWDKIATGTVAGHIIECGAQATGGNCQYDWQSIPDFWDIGYPIVEASEDGTFIVTKHDGTGGRVSVPTVTEQLMYEMGDPKNYITPDGIADFTSINVAAAGENRVRVSGIKGFPGLGGEPSPDIAEVMVRVSVRSQDKASVERFATEIAPLALAGPPTVTGLSGGRPKVEEVVAYWPALMPKTAVSPIVEIITV